MRSALLCVIFALIVHKEVCGAANEEFKPTPIPISDWNNVSVKENKGTSLEVISTEDTAAVHAHYWEDALRHSVYLTLVRDKIDQLIAKGTVISPENKPEEYSSKEIDDHDLWEKIKTAPFERLSANLAHSSPATGDMKTMAQGRLLQEQNGLRFIEDEISRENCDDEKCTQGVKAFWTVKRVRQRNPQTASGKYNYELTFSVTSHTPRKQKKTNVNPVRTYTVREGIPVEKPEHRTHDSVDHALRPQRAVWFHKNIGPASHYEGRKNQLQGLDRLFSSWFPSEEDSREDTHKRYKPHYTPSTYPQYFKSGYVGAQTEHTYQKKLIPYPYKPQSMKFSRPPLGPPPVTHIQQHYADLELIGKKQYSTPQTEFKYQPTNPMKTTKPSVLPTPPASQFPFNVTMEVRQNINSSDFTTREPEIITAFTTYSRVKSTPAKVSYFSERVRPPVFNAPPGVFVTMDKKPFKPMPPLKFIQSKPMKNRPIDFRPSPQVLDVQFSDPDPLSDSFRPITMNYVSSNTTEVNELTDIKITHNRKSKPPKKHEKKFNRVTTNLPDIITAHNDEEIQWANILSAFTKTTPMVSEKTNVIEMTTPVPDHEIKTMITEIPTSVTEEAEKEIIVSTTTFKPKRTRPPPKFTKPVKIKKHKRVNSITTTTTSTTTTLKSPSRRPSLDLTPLASSAASNTKNWQPQSKTQNDTQAITTINTVTTTIPPTMTPDPLVTTTMKIIPTTYRVTSTNVQLKPTSTEVTSTSIEETTVSITHPRNKNRFRQSTLFYKGTSVKHDKWSASALEKNKTMEKNKLTTPTTGKFFPRRKGSNFQGYINTSPKTIDLERKREDHKDIFSNSYLNYINVNSTINPRPENVSSMTPWSTQSKHNYNETDLTETEDPDEENYEETDGEEEDKEEIQLKDNEEYIFTSQSAALHSESKVSNEIETASATEVGIFSSIRQDNKTKTKCKKKKVNNLTAADETLKSKSDASKDTTTTTEKMSTSDFFSEIFGITGNQNEKYSNHTDSEFVDKEDLVEFLDSINEKKDSNETNENEDYEDEVKDLSPFNNDEDNRFQRQADDDYPVRPISFLELMAME